MEVGIAAAPGRGVARDVLVGRAPPVVQHDSEVYVILTALRATTLVADDVGQLNDGISICDALAMTTLGVAALWFAWSATFSQVTNNRAKE